MRVRIMRWFVNGDPEWQAWFAWFPVQVDNKWVWLETVERRWTHNAGIELADIYAVEVPGYVYRNARKP